MLSVRRAFPIRLRVRGAVCEHDQIGKAVTDAAQMVRKAEELHIPRSRGSVEQGRSGYAKARQDIQAFMDLEIDWAGICS